MFVAVNVEVNGKVALEIKVQVGEGRQTFKWLATVVQTRLKEQQLLRRHMVSDTVLVKAIKNAAGELINPNDYVCEHKIPDALGVTVYCEIMDVFESDACGFPVYDDFLQAAYMVSDASSKWALESQIWRESERARVVRDKEAALYDDDVEGNDVHARLAMRRRKVAQLRSKNGAGGFTDDMDGDVGDDPVLGGSVGSTLVQIGSDFTPAEIEAAFALDWGNMSFSWYKGMTELNKIALYDTLKEHYDVVCTLFVHYCGMGRVGERWGMSMIEFEHLLMLATGKKKLIIHILVDKVYKTVTGRKAGRKVDAVHDAVMSATFAGGSEDVDDAGYHNDVEPGGSVHSSQRMHRSASNAASRSSFGGKTSASSSSAYLGPPAGDGMWPLLTRQMFAEFLICFAFTEVEDQTIGEVSAAMAAELLFVGPLRKFVATARNTWLKYTHADSFTVNETAALLKEYYLLHASVDPYLGPSLSMSAFEALMVSSQMLIEADNDKGKEQMLCEVAFSWALMCDPPEAAAESKPMTAAPNDGLRSTFLDEPHMEAYTTRRPVVEDTGKLGLGDALCFTEFVEALSKLSLITMQEEAGLSEMKKILVGLNFVVEYYVTGSFEGLSGRGDLPSAAAAVKNAASRQPTAKPVATVDDANSGSVKAGMVGDGSSSVKFGSKASSKTVEGFGNRLRK
jgi:hypothetical protein